MFENNLFIFNIDESLTVCYSNIISHNVKLYFFEEYQKLCYTGLL